MHAFWLEEGWGFAFFFAKLTIAGLPVSEMVVERERMICQDPPLSVSANLRVSNIGIKFG